MTRFLMVPLIALGCIAGVIFAATASSPQGGAGLAALPEGDTGLAARYPGDAGIEKDAKVVFTDTFESGKTNGDNAWGDIVYTDQPENVHGGKRAMELKIVRPSNQKSTSIGMYKHFKAGFDALFLRYYMKFGKDTDCSTAAPITAP